MQGDYKERQDPSPEVRWFSVVLRVTPRVCTVTVAGRRLPPHRHWAPRTVHPTGGYLKTPP